MFWKKTKEAVVTCEHEWHIVSRSICDYELYCPKCNRSRHVETSCEADAYVLKSQLRKEHLEGKRSNG